MGASDFQTLSELFLTAVEKHPKPDAFLVKSAGQYGPISSREALQRVAAVAAVFRSLGVACGDRVGVLSENRLEWALTDHALLGIGAVSVPIYPTLLEDDIEYVLSDSGAKGIVVSSRRQLAKVLKVRPRLEGLKFVVAMDGRPPEAPDVLSWQESVGAQLDYGEDLVEAFCARARAVTGGDIASILYTSGTMGKPKGVVLTHANLVSNIRATEGLFPLGKHDLGMSLLPLCHVFERMLDFEYFRQGVCIAYPESFETLPQDIREVRPTVMAVVPRVLEKIHQKVMERVQQASPLRQKLFRWALGVGRTYFPHRLENRTPPLGLRIKHALAHALVFSKIRAQIGGRMAVIISGAAPLSGELAKFFYALGLPVYEGYGLTETSPVISVNYPGHVKLGTVGPVISGVSVRLGEEIEDSEGRIGAEILVQGPSVTPGYYHLEEENRRAFVDGWFRTGDLGRLDSDGYLTITGRKKNLFKTSGGKYVSPEKLENLFQGHSYISQIVVLGDARRFIGALIVPRFDRLETYARSQGLEFTNHGDLVKDAQVNAFMQKQIEEVNRSLPPHENIRQFVLLPQEFGAAAGELSATQKIRRSVVEERYREQIEEMFQRHAPQPVRT